MHKANEQKIHEEMSKRNIEVFAHSLQEAQKNLGKYAAGNVVLEEKVREALRANDRLLQGTAENYLCSGSLSYAAAVVWGTLTSTPTLNFAGWGSLTFSGTHWGVGAGGGISLVSGFSTVNPATLLGDIEYSMAFTSGPPGAINVTFWRSGALLASVTGAALNVGTPGVFGGTGKFTR